ncbi:MAG: TRAP transporter large permease [Acidobacteriota bacterium]
MTAFLANPAAALPLGWAEPLTLLLMLACFGGLAVAAHWPLGLALVAAAWLGASFNGEYVPLRHLVEGASAYLDPILVIATAMIFMQALADGRALEAVGSAVERRFATRPLLLVPLLMLMLMFPGMVTGSSTAAVLTTGAMVASVLGGLGLARERAAALVAMGAILGMVAPPINIPAMIICGGLDLPFAGFAVPLALASFPLALGLGIAFAWPLLGSANRARSPATLAGAHLPRPRLPVWRALLAPLMLALLMAAPRLSPGQIPDLGLPLMFLAAAAVAVLALPRFAIPASLFRATDAALPVLGILTGVGAFIQVMTCTGARGWLVSLMVGAPASVTVAAAAVSIPLFGAVSAFGSASVLGVPFLLVLAGRDEIVTTSALSLLASLGDLMLPAALAPTLAAQVAGVSDRRAVLRLCIVPALLAVAVAVLMLIFSPALGKLLA